MAAETAAAASSYSLVPLCLTFLPAAVTAGSLWLGKKLWEGKLLKEQGMESQQALENTKLEENDLKLAADSAAANFIILNQLLDREIEQTFSQKGCNEAKLELASALMFHVTDMIEETADLDYQLNALSIGDMLKIVDVLVKLLEKTVHELWQIREDCQKSIPFTEKLRNAQDTIREVISLVWGFIQRLPQGSRLKSFYDRLSTCRHVIDALFY